MLKIFANPSLDTLLYLIHGVEDGALFVYKSLVL